MGRIFVIAAALVLLAGCGGQKVADPPVSTHTPSPTVSATPTPPVMPALAKEHTEAGAKAFVEYYFAVGDYAAASGDTEPLRALAAPGCAGCNGAVGALQDMAARGGHSHGGASTVTDVTVVPLNEVHDPMRVDFSVTSDRQTITYTGTASPEVHPGGTVRLQFIITPTPAGWSVGYWAAQ